jgi:hypothetical protein
MKINIEVRVHDCSGAPTEVFEAYLKRIGFRVLGNCPGHEYDESLVGYVTYFCEWESDFPQLAPCKE